MQHARALSQECFVHLNITSLCYSPVSASHLHIKSSFAALHFDLLFSGYSHCGKPFAGLFLSARVHHSLDWHVFS